MLGVIATLGLVILAAGIAYALAIWFLQDRLIYLPVATSAQVAAGARAQGAAVMSFRCADADQTAWLLPPRPGAPRTLLMACIGNAGCAAMWFERPDYLLPSLHARLGIAILAVDFPGYGDCPGRPSPASMLAQTRAAQAAALAQLGWDRSGVRLAVIGMSLGTGAASAHAAAEGIPRLALISPYTSLLDMARIRQPWPFWHLLRHRFDNRAALATLARNGPSRVQIWHGDRDRVIPVEHSRQLAGEFSGQVIYREVVGAGHDDVIVVAQAVEEMVTLLAYEP